MGGKKQTKNWQVQMDSQGPCGSSGCLPACLPNTSIDTQAAVREELNEIRLFLCTKSGQQRS